MAAASQSLPSQSTGRSEQHLTTVLDSINAQVNSNAGGSEDVHIDMDQLADAGEDAQSHGHTHRHTAAAQQTNEALAIMLPYLSRFGPFVLILLLKVLYSHRYGLLLIIATIGTWYYANNILTTQITLRSHGRHKLMVTKLTWIISVLSASLFGIYYFLDVDHTLLYRLVLTPHGLSDTTDVWTLLWLVIITDYCVKYMTIIIKSLLTLTPRAVASNQTKGNLYILIERATQLYRSLLPFTPWYYFLLGSPDGPWFSAVIFVAYFVLKFLYIYKQWSPLKAALMKVFSSQESFGRKPTSEELEGTEGTCPVCHDEYTEPVMLLCKHIFCEDCVLVWFDRETSCPMCRAKIIMGDNSFRDGSSCWNVQFY